MDRKFFVRKATLAFVFLASPAFSVRASAAPVEALFDLEAMSSSPFPSDRFTRRDRGQNTARRVNLPKPDCSTHVNDCGDIDLLNELDGFNIQPRLSIPFSGPIDVSSVNSETVFLLRLGDARSEGEDSEEDSRAEESREESSLESKTASSGAPRRTGIERVVWDVATNTLHVESADQLEQHTRYLLVVTRGVHDAAGSPIERSKAFDRFHRDLNFGQTKDRDLKEYRKALIDALDEAADAGIRLHQVAVASVFSTMSVTAILEKLRDHVLAMPPPSAGVFRLGPPGPDGQGIRTVFTLNEGPNCSGPTPAALCGLTFNQQTSESGALVPASLAVQLGLLRIFPGKVGRVAFGKYVSPNYLLLPEPYIPPFGTRSGTPQVQGQTEVYFNLFLPSGTSPPGGWPVVIFGHGSSTSKNTVPFNVASSNAAHGLATIAINIVAHGFGQKGTLTAELTNGTKVTFPSGGRGIDQNKDGVIGAEEGSVPSAPRSLLRERHAQLQTAVDLIQLINAIEVGMDVDGDGIADLDASHIYYAGNSAGAAIGGIFAAVDRRVRAAVLTAPGAGPEFTRLSPPARPIIGGLLDARIPSLLNGPGLTSIGGILVGKPTFNENLPLPGDDPVVNTFTGAMAIQELFDRAEWLAHRGAPAAFAPHLRKTPLKGVPVRPVIVQFSRGDQQVVNPATAALLRAGDLLDRATLYRHDLFAGKSQFKNPHTFALVTATPVMKDIALLAQAQTATFFASDGRDMIDPDGATGTLFEVPFAIPLSELERDLKFVP